MSAVLPSRPCSCSWPPGRSLCCSLHMYSHPSAGLPCSLVLPPGRPPQPPVLGARPRRRHPPLCERRRQAARRLLWCVSTEHGLLPGLPGSSCRRVTCAACAAAVLSAAVRPACHLPLLDLAPSVLLPSIPPSTGANVTFWNVAVRGDGTTDLPPCDFGPLLNFIGRWAAVHSWQPGAGVAVGSAGSP